MNCTQSETISLRVCLAILAAVLGLALTPRLASAVGVSSFTLTGSMSTDRDGAFAAPLPDGRVLIAGGFVGDYYGGHVLASAEIFNPPTGTFMSTSTGPMTTPREVAAAALLGDGRVLIAGGAANSTGTPLASAEVFDPRTNTFSSAGIGSMAHARFGPSAASLPDGRVLVVGGCCDGGNEVATPEIFDPTTNTFSSAGLGPMSTPRQYAVAAPLPDGRVVVAGGFDTSYIATAEIFDPSTGTFTSSGIGPMTTPRSLAAAAPLGDGRILIAGGTPNAIAQLSSAEVFDPATKTFSADGITPMTTARVVGSAAPLRDGEVLVTGGHSETGSLSTAEIYGPVNTFRLTLRRRLLMVDVQSSGRVSVRDASAPLGTTSSSAKRQRKLRLKPSSASGDPPTIRVRLALTRSAKRRLKKTGRLKIAPRVTFTPQGGRPHSETAVLKVRK